MTFPHFFLALGIGSALLAFWFVVRFPKLGPENFRQAMIHVGIALGIGWFSPSVYSAFVAYGFSGAMVGIFVLIFPVLFYTFLSGAWFLKVATGAMNQFRH
jgi:hypothetical protein